jgi:hypothetical protein
VTEGQHPPATPAMEEPEQDEQERHEDHHETLLGAFRQRALALLRADRRLRLYTGIAIAQLLVCTILALTGDLPLPRIGISSSGSGLSTVPVLILVISLLLQAIAWGMFLTGLLDTRWPIQVLGLIVFAIAFGQFLGPLTLRPVNLFLALVLMTAVAAAAAVARWRRHQRLGSTGLLLFAVNSALVGALYANSWVASVLGGSAILFGLSLSVQLGLLSFVIITVLFLAGTDFAEWGEVTGERLGKLAERVAGGRAWVVPAIAVLVSAGIFADTVRQYRTGLVQQLVMAILGLALIAAVVLAARALHHRRPVRLPVAALAAAAALDLVFFLIAVLAAGAVDTRPAFSINGIQFATYTHEKDPQFMIERPALWEVKSFDSPPGLLVVNGLVAANQGMFYVITYTAADAGADPMATWVKSCCPSQDVVSGNPHPYGPWTESDFVDHFATGQLVGTTWTRTDGDRVWLLYGVSNPAIVSLNTPVFRHMVDTWRPGVAPAPKSDAANAAAEMSQNRVLAINSGFWVLVAFAAALFLLFRRRARPGLAAAAIFLALVGALYLLQTFGSVLAAFGLRLQLGPLHLQGMRIQGVQATVAILTAATAAWLAVRRRLAAGAPVLLALIGLAIGLQVLSWMFFVFDQKQARGGLTVIQVALVTLALLWDVVMSGGAMAQGQGRWFPRQSRVLLYFGFDVLVAATVLFFASLRDQATGAAGGLDVNTDFWPQSGLIILGVPMLLALFVLKLGRMRTRSHHRPPQEPA